MYTDRDGAGALLARGRGTLIEGGVCGLSTLPALVACTHILETLVVSSVTPRTAPCAAHLAKMRRRERDPSRTFNHVSCSNSWRSAAGGLMRLGNCASTAVGKKCKVCGMPRVCRAQRPGRETVPGTRADRFHPGCQRPRGPRDLGARHPHSPPAASDRGSLTSTALARLPRFWCTTAKAGRKPVSKPFARPG